MTEEKIEDEREYKKKINQEQEPGCELIDNAFKQFTVREVNMARRPAPT